MSHSYISSYLHCVFSTKNREPSIDEELETRLWPYLGGVARENNITALSIGGVEDHVHMLLSMPATISLSEAMKRIKGASSKWVSDTFSEKRAFNWQEGYGAFSVGISQLDVSHGYIANQKEHHRKTTFEEEYTAFLEKHGIDYDKQYVFG